MLILVGVTINVALNGGLFDKAKNAATETEKESIYEQIIMGMQLEDGKIDVAETFAEAQETLEGYTITQTSSGTNYIVLTVEGKNGTYTYTITDGKIVIGEEIPAVINPVAGIYYQPNRTVSMTLNESGTIIAPAEWGLEDNATYTYTDSSITASNGVTLEFYKLANNKILINESMNIMFATNRNGLEGEEITGTYVNNSSGYTLIIDSNEGTWETITNSGNTKGSGNYYYYNKKIYSDGGLLWGAVDENGNILVYYSNGYDTYTKQ